MKYFKYLGLSLLLFSSFLGMGQTVTLSLDNSTIAENGTATITATLNASHSGETIISFAPTGSALINGDYEISYVGRGNDFTVAGVGDGSFGYSLSQLYDPTDVTVDSYGNVYVVDCIPSAKSELIRVKL